VFPWSSSSNLCFFQLESKFHEAIYDSILAAKSHLWSSVSHLNTLLWVYCLVMSLVSEYIQALAITCELVYAVRYSFFWDMALCHWVTDAWHFQTASRTTFKDQTTMLSWNMDTNHPVTQCQISEEQTSQLHHCKSLNLIYCVPSWYVLMD